MMDKFTDINQLDYNQLIFRQIDRIQIIAHTEWSSAEQKLFATSWSIKLFKSLITDELKDKTFTDKEKELKESREDILKLKKEKSKQYSFEDDFNNLMESFESCMNLFGRRGHLYKNVIHGHQE